MTFSTTFHGTFRFGVEASRVNTLWKAPGILAQNFRMSKPMEGTPLKPFLDGIGGAYNLISIGTGGYGGGLYNSNSSIYDYYYQIWVLPAFMSINNPQLNSGIPFTVWNAYPYENIITNVVKIGDPGTTISLMIGNIFQPIEFHNTTITVEPSAPSYGDAQYTFQFQYGIGIFNFSYQMISNIAEVLPETPTIEVWEWKTDIITSTNAHIEQRIAQRLSPRINFMFKMLVLNEENRRKNFQLMFNEIQTTKLVPFFQYSSFLTSDAVALNTRVYFDPRLCDARVGEYIFIYDRNQQQYKSHLVTVLHNDGATIDPPLLRNFSKGSFVTVVHDCLIQDGSGLTMRNVNGEITFNAIRRNTRELFVRPGATVSMTTFNGRPVITQRPYVENDISEKFSMDSRLVDSETGVYDVVLNRKYPYIVGNASYKVQRYNEPQSMDNWRHFFDTIRGKQGSFYLATWRRDFVLTEDIGNATNIIYTENNKWKNYYEGKPEFSAIQFVAQDGETIQRGIVSVVETSLGYTITLDSNIPDFNKWKSKNIICSFLFLVRMSDDQITWTHQQRDSFFQINVRTVQE